MSIANRLSLVAVALIVLCALPAAQPVFTGYENLSAFVPIEIAAIEKVMKEPGLQKR